MFRTTRKGLVFLASIRPTTDLELRKEVISRLSDECGFKTFFKNKEHIGNNYTALGRESLLKWKDDEEPEDEVIEGAIRKKLDQIAQRVASIPEALRPLFEGEVAIKPTFLGGL